MTSDDPNNGCEGDYISASAIANHDVLEKIGTRRDKTVSYSVFYFGLLAYRRSRAWGFRVQSDFTKKNKRLLAV